MYAIIIGCGRVGSLLATALCAEGNNIVVIDMKESKLRLLSPEFTGQTIVGDGTDISTLEEAKIMEADTLVAATNDDNTNLMSGQIAKKIFNVPRVLVRIKDPNRLDVYKEYELETVSATTLAAEKLGDMLKTSREIEILSGTADRKAKIVRFSLPTPQICNTVQRMISSGIFNPSIVDSGGKLSLGLPKKLVPGLTLTGSILTENLRRLNRMFTSQRKP